MSDNLRLHEQQPGLEQHISAERTLSAGARFDETLRVADLGGEHVWTALVMHLIRDPASIGPDMHLDAESVVSANVGCYRCEQPFDPRLIKRRCPGDPRS